MKVLVTGASGRIGRAIYVRLALEHEVVGFDRAPSSTADVVGDLCDRRLLLDALRGVDAVIHTASLHAPHVNLLPEEEFERVNVVGTQLLAECCRRCGVSRLVYTSTTALYGSAATPESGAGWVTEALAPEPRTIYHRTKLAAEALLGAQATRGDFQVTFLRISRCFPEPAPKMAVYRLHRGIDARDAAEAHVQALRPASATIRTYVISGKTPFLPCDCALLLRDAPTVLRRRTPDLVAAFTARGWSLPTSIDRVYDSTLAQRELGWAPRFGFTEVLSMYDQGYSEVLPPRKDQRKRSSVQEPCA